jgi:pimeloyl-ACP methyl ester carboxylesterase
MGSMTENPKRAERVTGRRFRFWFTAIATVVLAAVAIPGLGASADAAASATHRAPKPTIVLVHGAWADGSSWNGVVERPQHDGYPGRVPPNPLRSLPTDSATIASFLATISGPIILVGHSYGGAVITNAATGNPNVKALVYVDAFAPDQGETVLPLAGSGSALAVDPTTVFDFVPYPGAPAGDVDLYIKQKVFLNSFANGVPTKTAKLLYAAQRPFAFSAGNEPSGVPAWKTIPSWYVLGTADKIITPAQQLLMAQRAKATIVRVNAGHLSMVSHPSAVTDVIIKAARNTT